MCYEYCQIVQFPNGCTISPSSSLQRYPYLSRMLDFTQASRPNWVYDNQELLSAVFTCRPKDGTLHVYE